MSHSEIIWVLFIFGFSGIVGGLVWVRVWYRIAKRDPDPTVGGAYAVFTLLTTPLVMLGSGLVGVLLLK